LTTAASTLEHAVSDAGFKVQDIRIALGTGQDARTSGNPDPHAPPQRDPQSRIDPGTAPVRSGHALAGEAPTASQNAGHRGTIDVYA